MKGIRTISQRTDLLKEAQVFFISAILFSLFISHISLAQTYVRTHKNIGFFGSVYMPDYAMRTGATKGATQGAGFSVGLTKQVGGIFYPEVFFVQHQNKVNVPLGREGWTQQSITTNAVGAGFLMKLDLLHFDSKKKNGYCFGRIMNLILGPEYVYPVGMNRAGPGLKQNGELAGKIGVGMYSYWGGSSKKHLGWTIHWELYYRHGFTPYLRTDFGTAGSNSYKLSSVGLTCRVIRHKTYKFSDM